MTVGDHTQRVDVLDHGYVELVETWGSDRRIVEAARMSTGKGFLGWGPDGACARCDGKGRIQAVIEVWDEEPTRERFGVSSFRFVGGRSHVEEVEQVCPACGGRGAKRGDEKLLDTLYNNDHSTPFEMAGAIFEVQAPISVFRQWHRHRTQSYNEASARYTPLPDVSYVPTVERLMMGAGQVVRNTQAGAVKGSDVLTEAAAEHFRSELRDVYTRVEALYQWALGVGIPKELAREHLPVGRYSKMRASANLRNWFGFLTLRLDEHAQWEIRQFAGAVGLFLAREFPRSFELFNAAFVKDA